MSEVDPMEHLALQTEHNALMAKHTDLRQATKLLCESINDILAVHPIEIETYYKRVCDLLEE